MHVLAKCPVIEIYRLALFWSSAVSYFHLNIKIKDNNDKKADRVNFKGDPA